MFKKVFYLFAVILSLHPSFAMELEDFSLNPTQSLKSFDPFFPTIPEDITLQILRALCKSTRALQTLDNIAQTSRKGYYLTHDPVLWEPLKQTYFSHLPQEYIDVLIRDRQEKGMALASLLFQDLMLYQIDELQWLTQILSDSNDVPYLFGDCGLPERNVEFLDDNFKKEQLKQLEKHLKKFGCNKKSNNKNENIQKYYSRESILKTINSNIMEKRSNLYNVSFIKIKENNIKKNIKVAHINLKGVLTRLPAQAVVQMQNNLRNNGVEFIRLHLHCNHLRILPEELFAFPLTYLDLRNNLLTYLPSNVTTEQHSLDCLYLGNYKGIGDGGECCISDHIGRRTTGNYFEKVPSAILNFSKLESLDMSSVGLQEFSEEEIYPSLPDLKIINLAHNNLKKKPATSFNDRTIAVQTIGNPCHSFLTWDKETRNYIYDAYFIRSLASPFMEDGYVVRHPFKSIVIMLGTFYTLSPL